MTTPLPSLYWIGGSPCAGKTTIASRLAEQRGWTLYNCDDAFYRHLQIITPADQPAYYRVTHLDCEDLWINRPVAQQVAEELEIYREEFPLILADLAHLPADRPILAEGAALLPELVAPLLGLDSRRLADSPPDPIAPRRAVWIVPSEAFQRRHYSQREWWPSVVRNCSDPALAFDNWMARDAAFARTVRAQAEQRGLPVLVVDGRASLEENFWFVEKKLE